MHFKAEVLCRAHSVGRDLQEQLATQKYSTKLPTTKLKRHKQEIFKITGQECRNEDQGEVKGGRKKEVAVAARPSVGLYSGTNLCASRRGQ